MYKKAFYIIFLFLIVSFLVPGTVSAHQPRIIYGQQGDVQVNSPEISQAFYDELVGQPRFYFIDSSKDFELYLNLLIPEEANRSGRYSANIFLLKDNKEEKIASLDGVSFDWKEFYEEFGRDYFGRDYYLKGPELTQQVQAGKYKVEVYSNDNLGKYVLAVGKIESFDVKSVLNVYWQIPLLKLTFFKTSVLQFFLTPFGIAGVGAIGALLILLALINYIVGLIKTAIKHNQAKTMLLASTGEPMGDEIVQLLQKPAYDVMVGYITTAKNYRLESGEEFTSRSYQMMKDLGFNIELLDIEGKTEHEVYKFLELKDIIFVGGGNTFYLMNQIRKCNFERVVRKLLKLGKVYIGSSAGSIVAGRTIETASWKGMDENIVKLKNFKGMGLVPFNIIVHYTPEMDEEIKSRIKNPKKRAKKLRILADGQAILVQGKEIDLIGDGEAIIV